MKSWMSDVLVTLSTLVVAVGFGYLYYQSTHAHTSGGSRKPVGTITFERNLTQRRYGNRVVWEQVGDSTTLYNRDSIRTAAGSYAVLTLKDGTRLTLSPNSLITLDWGTKSKTVDFLSGSISASRSGGAASSGRVLPQSGKTRGAGPPEGLVIKSGSSRVVLQDAYVNLAATKGALSMNVASGQATLAVGSKVRTVRASQSARVDTTTGSATVGSLAIAPRRPDNNAVFVTLHRQAPVAFAWRMQKGTREATLEISTTSSFGPGASSYSSPDRRRTVHLAPGDYYWRVSAGGAMSPVRRLSVLHDKRVVPQIPYAGQAYRYTTRPPLVSFAWTPSRVAGSYEVLVARNRSFSNIVDRVDVSASSVALDNLKSGTYYWRVLPVYGSRSPDAKAASASTSFRVVHQRALKAATLITPDNHASLNLDTVNSSGILFNWRADNAVGHWRIIVARDASLSHPVIDHTTSNNYFLFRNSLTAGTYYWRVKGRSTSGVAGPPSVTRTFKLHPFRATIDLVSPKSNWAYDGATFGVVPVVWRSDVTGTFEVELSTTADFSTLYRRMTTTFNNASFGPLPPGSYFWRVRLLASQGAGELSSANHTFTVLPPLAAPIAVSPSPSKSLKLINPKKLTFRWDGDPRSKFYNFRLYAPSTGSDRKLVVKAGNLTVNKYVFSNLSSLGPGTYTWQVSAHNPAGPGLSAQASPLTKATFTIGTLRFVPAPKLVKPTENDFIDGVTALDHGVTFRWVPPDRNGSSILQVASDREFLKGLHQLRARGGTASLPQLLPGIYYWRVKSKTQDGITAPRSKVDEFTVNALPPLAQPARVSPGARTTVSMWNKKAIAFSWSPVRNATGYDISLTNLETGVRIFHVSGLIRTSYRYRDLHNLDVGKFEWTVVATQVDDTGKVVRSSPPMKMAFDISLGKKIATPNIKTGKQFFVH